MFQTNKYQAPNKDFFDTYDKIRFYTGLPSMEVLMVVFEHVSPHVTRQTQLLDRFQEFIIVLMKLRLNAPLQDLAYQFVVHCQQFPEYLCVLARQGPTVDNNATVLPVCIRKENNCCDRLL